MTVNSEEMEDNVKAGASMTTPRTIKQCDSVRGSKVSFKGESLEKLAQRRMRAPNNF